MIYYQKSMYTTNNIEDDWGQFDDLENYDIFEIQKVNVSKSNNKSKSVNVENNAIINIKNSFNSFCEVYNINIEFNSLSAFCRFWSCLTVLTLTVGLSSYFTKKELC